MVNATNITWTCYDTTLTNTLGLFLLMRSIYIYSLVVVKKILKRDYNWENKYTLLSIVIYENRIKWNEWTYKYIYIVNLWSKMTIGLPGMLHMPGGIKE